MPKNSQRTMSVQFRKLGEDDARTVTFVASTAARDSAHTVLNQKGWDLARFNDNPIIGYNHGIYGSWDVKDVDFVVGKGRAYVEDDRLMVDVTFEPAEINELAEKIYQKILFGSINAVSVGFRPIGQGHWGDGDEAAGEENETYYYAGQELVEISIVNIPSNPEAVKKSDDAVNEELEALRAEAVKPKADPQPKPEDQMAIRALEIGKACAIAEAEAL